MAMATERAEAPSSLCFSFRPARRYDALYQRLSALPVLRTERGGGAWIAPRDAVVLDAAAHAGADGARVRAILLAEALPVCAVPRPLCRALVGARAATAEVSPSFLRQHFRRTDAKHPSLAQRDAALFVLRACASDLLEGADDGGAPPAAKPRDGPGDAPATLGALAGLPLLPLADGALGRCAAAPYTTPRSSLRGGGASERTSPTSRR